MTQVLEEKRSHVANFTRVERAIGGGSGALPGWLQELRRDGIERFEVLGFPTTKDEEWRFTDVRGIARTKFALGAADPVEGKKVVDKFTFGQDCAVELVFVNGQYVAAMSNLGRLPKGVTVASIGETVKGASGIEKQLGKYADANANAFVALNQGFAGEGAYVHLAKGVTLKGAIHLLFVSTAGVSPTVSHPRVLIVAEDNVEAQVVESYAGLSGVYFTNVVTEIVVGRDCRIDHCRLQQESPDAFHVSTTQIKLEANANFVSHSANVGGSLVRNDLNCRLDGEYADATLNGLNILNGEQHCDNHTLLHHEKASCPSHELYKYILGDRSSGVFKGKIYVQKDAQKTNSKQTSKSLLLSDDATIDAMPALEIYADDVKCTHGSTIGPLDEDMLFYLRSRGVSMDAAKHLLSYAFAADITRRIRVAPVRVRLEDYMAAQHGLPLDLRITDLGQHDEAAR
jgi:Fe-S cluster assembly protein SufD